MIYILNSLRNFIMKQKFLNKKFFVDNNSFLNKKKIIISKKKSFFIIKRSPGGGFFSNLLYVLKNLEYSKNKSLIPVVDMQNYITNYNEKKNLYGIKNVWELYFSQVSNYKLKEVYKSSKLIFSKKNFKIKLSDYKDKRLKKIFNNYISIKPYILNKIYNFEKKNFYKKNILGVHFRGTDQKITPGHSLPPSIFQIYNYIDKVFHKKKYDKIFLVSEQKSYVEKLKERYKSKIVYFNSFRANKINDFNLSLRKFHRNKLGQESLIEAVLLSKCRGIIYSKSNINSFAFFYAKNKIIKYEINNGLNSSNIIVAYFAWVYRVYLPSSIKYFYKFILQKFT